MLELADEVATIVHGDFTVMRDYVEALAPPKGAEPFELDTMVLR